jgi:hypothetical protein
MPIKRREPKARISAEGVSAFEWGVLTDEIIPDGAGGWDGFMATWFAEPGSAPGGVPTIGDLWLIHGEAITADWAEERPGSRPSCWWRWTAPEKRREVDLDLLEPQGVYLKRLGLFLPGEEARTTQAAWQPEEA